MAKSKKKKGVSDKVRLAKTKKKALSKIGIEQRNPFEVKINKQKHKILGRKLKHDRGLPGVSRSKSTKKRKETLLHEYKYMNKANQIKDERLGVNNNHLSLEEKMLQRFALEKKKKHEKFAQFNLNDEEELTHLGQTLSSITNFDDALASDDEEGALSADYVEQAHFGGGMFKKKGDVNERETETAPKSRKDVMLDIIAKSKTAKYERQNEKEQSDQLLTKLDSEFETVRKILQPTRRTKKDKEDDLNRAKKDEYDMVMRAMMFDRKVNPGEKPKTIEELAKEKEVAIRKQEADRIARMNFSLEEKKPQHQSADALCDNFAVTEKDENPAFLAYPIIEEPPPSGEDEDQNELEDENAEDEEKDSEIADQGIVEDGTSVEDDAQDEESDAFSDIDSGNEDDVDLVSLAESETANSATEEEIASRNTISSFPSSYAEFASLITGGLTAAELTKRFRKDFAPSARKGNKAKMIELFAYVWEHCCRMASLSPPNMNVINTLCSHLYELCQLNLESCTDCVLERLKRSYLYCFNFRRSMRPKWPKFEMLMQFKLIKLFYSTSDYSHIIATRSLLFICKALNHCRVNKTRDLACGLFLCTLAYEYVCFSKRFLPECLNFLCSCLSMSLPKDEQRQADFSQIVSVHLDKTNGNFLALNAKTDFRNIADRKLNLIQLLNDNASMELNDALRYQFLMAAIKLSEKFVQLYTNMPSFDEVIAPLYKVCKIMVYKQTSLPKSLVTELKNLLNLMEENFEKPRKRLSFGPKKPKPLRLFDPKIQPVGEPFDKKSRNLTAQQKEKERLLHKHKRELKGATREIRKDAIFLSRQRQKEQEEKDAERREKVKRLYGLLSNQEGEVKQIKRRKYVLEI